MGKVLLSVFFVLALSGCEGQDDQILTNQEGFCIDGSEDILGFKFCLLDESNIPMDTFKEGENFIFNLKLSNNSNDTLVIEPDFINSSFYEVNDLLGGTFGQPYSGVWCEFSGAPQVLQIDPGAHFILNCPWLLKDGEEPVYPLCKAESNEILPTGEYYTQMKLDLKVIKSSDKKTIKGPFLRLNFKIE